MARYILIDAYTACIFGDSADIDGKVINGTPCEVAKALDESIGEHGRTYVELSRAPARESGYYIVYRADADGSDQVPTVTDGQDREAIAAVIGACPVDCYVEWSRAED
jgi:hypothetical protein